MILGFGDFLTDNAVIIILVLLGVILLTVSYLKKNVLAKYKDMEEEDDYQTPEEILQDEMDNLVVTEKYNPNQKVKKKDILNDYDDDDYDYDNVTQETITEMPSYMPTPPRSNINLFIFISFCSSSTRLKSS